MKSLQGYLLVATPELVDPNFVRTVVLIVRHDDSGALGVILNRPTNTSIQSVWKQVSAAPCLATGPLHFGGPIQGPLMAVHERESVAETRVLDGLCFSMKPGNMERLVSEPDGAARYFIGYSGWGGGQLETELDEGSWRTTPARPEAVFEPTDRLWEQTQKEIVGQQVLSWLRIKQVPADPRLN